MISTAWVTRSNSDHGVNIVRDAGMCEGTELSLGGIRWRSVLARSDVQLLSSITLVAMCSVEN